MFQPRNRQSFKERGKAAAGLGPRQFHHAHPVLGALQARRRGMQNRSILTRDQRSASNNSASSASALPEPPATSEAQTSEQQSRSQPSSRRLPARNTRRHSTGI